MKVLLVNTDAGGSKFYRLDAPASAVRSQFPGIEIIERDYINVDAELDTLTHHTRVNEIQEDVDVIVIQRPLAQDFNAMLNQAHKQGIATCVEIDDDFETIHPKNAAYDLVQPENHPTNNRTWLLQSALNADLVLASTPALLKQYASHGRGYLLPNYMPKDALNIHAKIRSRNAIGWTGTVQTHPTDLHVLGTSIRNVLSSTHAHFHIVGDGKGIGKILGISNYTQSGWVPLDEYLPEIKQHIAIGIVPLDDIPFNHAKSYLKGLEYAALGIPFVASPVSDYRYLQSIGIGELAGSPREWRKKLTKLLVNDRYRSTRSMQYRDIVAEKLTYEHNAHRWVSAWEQAIKNRNERQ